MTFNDIIYCVLIVSMSLNMNISCFDKKEDGSYRVLKTNALLCMPMNKNL